MKRYRQDPNTGSHVHALFESAKLDELDAAKHRRVAERLGLLAAASTSPPSDPRGLQTQPPSTLGSIAKAGLVVVGLGVSTLSFTRTYYEIPAASPSTDALTTVASAGDPNARTVAPQAPADVIPSVDVASLPTVRPPPNRPAARHVESPSAAPSPVPAEELRLEIAQLDDVRRAASANQPREALRLLDAYAKRFPTGKLREEALVLRIEALHASGDQPGAEALAKRLFMHSPDTPYAARVRAAVGAVGAVGTNSREEP